MAKYSVEESKIDSITWAHQLVMPRYLRIHADQEIHLYIKVRGQLQLK